MNQFLYWLPVVLMSLALGTYIWDFFTIPRNPFVSEENKKKVKVEFYGYVIPSLVLVTGCLLFSSIGEIKTVWAMYAGTIGIGIAVEGYLYLVNKKKN